MAEIVGTVLSALGIVAKVVPFISELPDVDDEVMALHNNVQDRYKRLEFFRMERSRNLCEIDRILYDCQYECDRIAALINDHVTRIKEKGRVNIGQRLMWVFLNKSAVKLLNGYLNIALTPLPDVNVLLRCPLPPSPNSENFSTMQSNEHDPDFIHSASKPPCPTIRPRSLRPQMGEISDEETWPRRRISSVEYGSAGLDYGVVDRPRSAGPPSTISSKLDESDIGLLLARREIGFARRRGLE